ncbi:peptide chain release factor N(5)-glutamine methyltransferase [uncultured Muriicola sp.]|uniref:peptide chain release factor N(5)-glutamine methyltransferase n=1 Tax=uncultured Muriicola sp. TaxID=1583102 RepID=UPI002616FD30|nr:peptide chain release factor N(5)-glutamine methyltransferase [uncultured Muriicola sp.]
MLLKDIKHIFHQELDSQYGTEEVSHFFYYFVESYLGLPRFHLAIHPQWIITKEDESLFFEGLAALKQGKPIQYILGTTSFMDLILTVNEDVLIPRPETEGLVQWVLNDCQKSESNIKILDIGTGSGCIAIALAKNLHQAEVSAIDISKEALEVAKQNAKNNKVSVLFKNADVRDMDISEENYDIIVSNPPYVLEREKAIMQDHVKNSEPSLALFVPDTQPLLYYEYLAKLAQKALKEGGVLYLEINEIFGKEVSDLLKEHSFTNIEIQQDLHGKDRFIKGTSLVQ